MTTSNAASDENFIKMMTFPFQCWIVYCKDSETWEQPRNIRYGTVDMQWSVHVSKAIADYMVPSGRQAIFNRRADLMVTMIWHGHIAQHA